MARKTYQLTVAYDGTEYSGWQNQPNSLSIQQIIESALSTLLRTPVKLIGSGRTDAGVHALAQTAHFCTAQPVDLRKLLHSLNGILPRDIRIKEIFERPADFHARFSAIKKTYIYHLHIGTFQEPFQRLYSYHFREKIDLNLLQQATPLFIGTHDFTSFSNKPDQGSAANNPIKTLYALRMHHNHHSLRLEFEGNGFLYKMVRNIVGTLLEVGTGKIPLELLESIFTAKDRKKAGHTAPPHGLFLAKVDYPPSLEVPHG